MATVILTLFRRFVTKAPNRPKNIPQPKPESRSILWAAGGQIRILEVR